MIRSLTAIAATAAIFLPMTPAQAMTGKFRGEYMCGAMPNVPGLLRTPIDVTVDGDKIQFARPLYNIEGSRVVGTELASGDIAADGRVKLQSQWAWHGATANARYGGALTELGGTLVGDQVWSRDDHSETRTCVAAVVPVPKAAPAATNP
jgi:hypothetical protein